MPNYAVKHDRLQLIWFDKKENDLRMLRATSWRKQKFFLYFTDYCASLLRYYVGKFYETRRTKIRCKYDLWLHCLQYNSFRCHICTVPIHEECCGKIPIAGSESYQHPQMEGKPLVLLCGRRLLSKAELIVRDALPIRPLYGITRERRQNSKYIWDQIVTIRKRKVFKGPRNS